MRRWGFGLLLLALVRRWRHRADDTPGLGRVGREDGYGYRYAVRRRDR